jgi:putative ABC transport system permease protein
MPDARWVRRLTLRVRTLLLRDRVEQELDEEVRFHLEERIAAEVARGLSPQEARRIALMAIDGVDQTKEACRDTRHTQAIEHFFRDMRYALRSLARSPAFAAISILSLALGMGANTAIFSIVDKLLLESLPVRNPRELVLLNPAGLRNGWTAGNRTWSYQAYRGLREHQRVFAGLIAERTDAVNLTVDGATERAVASIVSGNYFDVLGVRALQGRLFGDEDDRIRSGHPVVVLSQGFWVERLGGRSDIVGRTLRVGGHPFTVIGITERGFNGLEVGGSVDLFVPTTMLPDVVTYAKALDERTAYIFQLYGRLGSGVERQQAEAQLQPLYLAELEQDVAAMGNRAPADDGWKRGRLLLEDGHRGTSGLRQDLETPLTAVMAMTIVLLLTACANIAGLQMARASARLKEISIRLAMGASRGRILQQLLTESAVIALLGALAGLWIAWLTIRLLVAEMGDTAERLRLVTTFLDARVLAFTFVFAAATGLAFGLLPALFATRPEVWPGLKSGIVAEVGGQARLRRVLVTAQLALSLVLVTASGLFGRTLLNLRSADAGFQTERLIQFQLNPGAAGYDRARSETLLHEVLDDLQSVPGVGRATLAVAPVLSNALIGFGLDVEGYPTVEGRRARAAANVVAPGYFGIVGTPLVRGREFSAADTARSRRVAIVSETFVRRYLPNLDPMGRTIGLDYGRPPHFYHEIVGVAKDARLNNLRDEPPPTFYLPYTQFDVLSNSFVLARIQTDPDPLRRPIEALIRRHDPELPVVAYSTVDEQIDRLLRPERLVASLSLAFGLLATGLGAIGLYGVVAFTVARRTREIGVRMALGAARSTVLRMVLRGVAGMAAIGIGAGAVLSLALARYVESQLYGVRGRDLATLCAAAAVLVVVALASGWLPARKASRVDPMLALRQD